jgi:hypothetical protein
LPLITGTLFLEKAAFLSTEQALPTASFNARSRPTDPVKVIVQFLFFAPN